MLVACDDEVQWDCMGVLHAANSLKRLTDLSAKPKMPLFLTFYQFYLGLGGPFQSGSVHLEYDIKFERVDVKFGTIDIRSAVLVASAPALFVLFAELFASRRKKTKQHRATIGQFRRNGVSELWRCLLAPSCFVYTHHPTAITANTATIATTAITAMFATSKCMPINC